MTNLPASVSVVIPVFNSSDTLYRCLKSISEQEKKVYEVIIIDDCSSEKDYLVTQDIVNLFLYQLKIILVRLEKNYGPGYARNYGVGLSSQKYIAFLDSDDVWNPQKIRIQYSLMENTGSIISGHVYIPNISEIKLNESSPMASYSVIRRLEFAIRNPYSTPTVMVLRNKFIGFPEKIRFAEDYICWLRNYRPGRTHFISIPLSGGFKKPVGESGLSSHMHEMHAGVLFGLRYLYQTREISVGFYLLAIMFEKIKWPIRRIKWERR